jgi:hypothetical protein
MFPKVGGLVGERERRGQGTESKYKSCQESSEQCTAKLSA